MGGKQTGKQHAYPKARKSYDSSRKGIGGRKPKNQQSSTKQKTYFDKLFEKRKAVPKLEISDNLMISQRFSRSQNLKLAMI